MLILHGLWCVRALVLMARLVYDSVIQIVDGKGMKTVTRLSDLVKGELGDTI